MRCPKTTLTDTELREIYSNGTKPGILPSTSSSAADRDSSGVLNKSAVNAIIETLKQSGIIPNMKERNSEVVMKKQDELLKNIKAEYAFYELKYKYAIEKLLCVIEQERIKNNSDIQTIIQPYLEVARELNRKLNDLIQIINGIKDNMASSTSELNDKVKEFDKLTNEKQVKLDYQNRIISSNQASVELNKQMVKFTEQKAKYTNNLLGLYSFFNVVALGLLVYVYKSARD
jgi:hypothetical protein